jgi:nicotinamidase-related amidase
MKNMFSLLIALFIMTSTSFSQHKDQEIKTALLVVDIQNFYFPGDGPGLLNAEATSLKAQEVLYLFRDHNQEVIFIRHQSEKGFEIHENVKPISGEKIITKNTINSFQDTNLLVYLKTKHITRLVIIGMQTQMCVEAATRAAYDFGFECIVIPEACTTRDLTYGDKTIKAEDVHASTLATLIGGGYAKVVDLETFAKEDEKYLYQSMD